MISNILYDIKKKEAQTHLGTLQMTAGPVGVKLSVRFFKRDFSLKSQTWNLCQAFRLISINQSNFYSPNIPSEARLSGATHESVFNSKIDEAVP